MISWSADRRYSPPNNEFGSYCTLLQLSMPVVVVVVIVMVVIIEGGTTASVLTIVLAKV